MRKTNLGLWPLYVHTCTVTIIDTCTSLKRMNPKPYNRKDTSMNKEQPQVWIVFPYVFPDMSDNHKDLH